MSNEPYLKKDEENELIANWQINKDQKSLNNIYKPLDSSITAHPETIYLTVVDKDLNVVSMLCITRNI